MLLYKKKTFCLRLNLGGREPSSVRCRRAVRWDSLADLSSGTLSFSQTLFVQTHCSS